MTNYVGARCPARGEKFKRPVLESLFGPSRQDLPLSMSPAWLRDALRFRIVNELKLHRIGGKGLRQRILLAGKDIRVFCKEIPDLQLHGVGDLRVDLNLAHIERNLRNFFSAIGV